MAVLSNQLLFLLAYPTSDEVFQSALLTAKKVASTCKALLKNGEALPEGLPYASVISTFTPDFLEWMLDEEHLHVRKHEALGDYNEVLKVSLPELWSVETQLGWNNDELLEALHVRPSDELPFLLQQLHRISALGRVRESYMDALQLDVKVKGKDVRFSLLFNRLSFAEVHTDDTLLKKFDHQALLHQSLPAASTLTEEQQGELITVVRTSMALGKRETDPATYLQPSSLRYYVLERGISVALFGMEAERQLPLESYIGFTLFKNGWPVSYGGAWIFGKRAKFGMNIFDAFRGGESGYVMMQLLRTYKQAFALSFIEVEPFQFGLDNPDGIRSGAYWFYYRYGFRSMDARLRTLADQEKKRMQQKPGYRSPEKTLIKFTEAGVALQLEKRVPMSIERATVLARKNMKPMFTDEPVHSRALQELQALAVTREQASLLAALKEEDEYAYQELLREVLSHH